jgi:1-acyl-sn-glycerol-3-phosphate acyltransferase
MPWIYRLSWLTVRGFARVYFRLRVYHADRVPPVGPIIIAANHASFADPPLIGCAVHRAMNFLARDTLFEVPGFGRLIRELHAIPVDRDGAGAAGLRAVLDRLDTGGGVLLFPEGTRSRNGNLQTARSGVGFTAIKSGARVVPVRVFNAFDAYGRHHVLPRSAPIVIKFGHPLGFERLRAEAMGCSKVRLKGIYQEVADEIMAEITRLEPCRDIECFP